MIKIGNTEFSKVYIGGDEISKVYLGSDLLYENHVEIETYDVLEDIEVYYYNDGVIVTNSSSRYISPDTKVTARISANLVTYDNSDDTVISETGRFFLSGDYLSCNSDCIIINSNGYILFNYAKYKTESVSGGYYTITIDYPSTSQETIAVTLKENKVETTKYEDYIFDTATCTPTTVSSASEIVALYATIKAHEVKVYTSGAENKSDSWSYPSADLRAYIWYDGNTGEEKQLEDTSGNKTFISGNTFLFSVDENTEDDSRTISIRATYEVNSSIICESGEISLTQAGGNTIIYSLENEHVYYSDGGNCIKTSGDNYAYITADYVGRKSSTGALVSSPTTTTIRDISTSKVYLTVTNEALGGGIRFNRAEYGTTVISRLTPYVTIEYNGVTKDVPVVVEANSRTIEYEQVYIDFGQYPKEGQTIPASGTESEMLVWMTAFVGAAGSYYVYTSGDTENISESNVPITGLSSNELILRLTCGGSQLNYTLTSNDGFEEMEGGEYSFGIVVPENATTSSREIQVSFEYNYEGELVICNKDRNGDSIIINQAAAEIAHNYTYALENIEVTYGSMDQNAEIILNEDEYIGSSDDAAVVTADYVIRDNGIVTSITEVQISEFVIPQGTPLVYRYSSDYERHEIAYDRSNYSTTVTGSSYTVTIKYGEASATASIALEPNERTEDNTRETGSLMIDGSLLNIDGSYTVNASLSLIPYYIYTSGAELRGSSYYPSTIIHAYVYQEGQEDDWDIYEVMNEETGSYGFQQNPNGTFKCTITGTVDDILSSWIIKLTATSEAGKEYEIEETL